MSLPKPHITRGGENIHHLANVPEMEDDEGYHFYEKTTGNTALHRLAKSGDCQSVKQCFANKDPEEVWNMVNDLTDQELLIFTCSGPAQEQPGLYSSTRGSILWPEGDDTSSTGPWS